jgi:hypothetical protein
VQVLIGEANQNKILTLKPGRQRLDYVVDPANRFIDTIVVESPIITGGGSRTLLRPEEIGKTGAGGVDRNYSALVEVAPTVTSDAGGLRIGGTSQRGEQVHPRQRQHQHPRVRHA